MTDYERGYRAGIEAAAKAVERQEWVEPNVQAAYARVVRALSAPAAPRDTGGCGVTTTKEMPAGRGRPAAPKAPERGACERCGGAGQAWCLFPEAPFGRAAPCPACKGTGGAP